MFLPVRFSADRSSKFKLDEPETINLTGNFESYQPLMICPDSGTVCASSIINTSGSENELMADRGARLADLRNDCLSTSISRFRYLVLLPIKLFL